MRPGRKMQDAFPKDRNTGCHWGGGRTSRASLPGRLEMKFMRISDALTVRPYAATQHVTASVIGFATYSAGKEIWGRLRNDPNRRAIWAESQAKTTHIGS